MRSDENLEEVEEVLRSIETEAPVETHAVAEARHEQVGERSKEPTMTKEEERETKTVQKQPVERVQ